MEAGAQYVMGEVVRVGKVGLVLEMPLAWRSTVGGQPYSFHLRVGNGLPQERQIGTTTMKMVMHLVPLYPLKLYWSLSWSHDSQSHTYSSTSRSRNLRRRKISLLRLGFLTTNCSRPFH